MTNKKKYKILFKFPIQKPNGTSCITFSMDVNGRPKVPPGAAKLGNFNNYYEFNSPEARINILPDDLVKRLELQNDHCNHVVCLDIGSNTGEMTLALCKLLSTANKSIHFLAVDVDGELVQRALDKVSLLNVAENDQKQGSTREITFRQLDIMSVDGQEICFEYPRTLCGRPRYDVVFCLSVTMWIHLNHGDEGLDRFLRFVASTSDRLIVEPQPWSCYMKAARRLRRIGDRFEHFDGLQVRGAGAIEKHIDQVLTSDDCGLVRCDEFGLTPWKRSLVLYKRPLSLQ